MDYSYSTWGAYLRWVRRRNRTLRHFKWAALDGVSLALGVSLTLVGLLGGAVVFALSTLPSDVTPAGRVIGAVVGGVWLLLYMGLGLFITYAWWVVRTLTNLPYRSQGRVASHRWIGADEAMARLLYFGTERAKGVLLCGGDRGDEAAHKIAELINEELEGGIGFLVSEKKLLTALDCLEREYGDMIRCVARLEELRDESPRLKGGHWFLRQRGALVMPSAQALTNCGDTDTRRMFLDVLSVAQITGSPSEIILEVTRSIQRAVAHA